MRRTLPDVEKAAAACIAIVDDEASVRTMLGRLLRLADYEVAAFTCGEEFIIIFPTHRGIVVPREWKHLVLLPFQLCKNRSCLLK